MLQFPNLMQNKEHIIKECSVHGFLSVSNCSEMLHFFIFYLFLSNFKSCKFGVQKYTFQSGQFEEVNVHFTWKPRWIFDEMKFQNAAVEIII